MSSSNAGKVHVDLSSALVEQWDDAYQWIPVFGAFAAFAVSFTAGANNLAAPFSTLIGSGVLSIFKASIIACFIYFPGAGFASRSTTVADLFSHFLKENQPNEGFLMWSMVVALLTAAIWLSIATYMELPVSPEQSIQGALLGIILFTEGFGYVHMWSKKEKHHFNGGLFWIFLEWTIAPFVACVCACLLFLLFKVLLLRHENARKRILAFLAIDFGISAGLLCLFVIFQIVRGLVPVNRWITMIAVAAATLIGAILSLAVAIPIVIKKFKWPDHNKSNKNDKCGNLECETSQEQTEDEGKNDGDVEDILRDFMQSRVLETVYEEEERSWTSPDRPQHGEQMQPVSSTTISTDQSAIFGQWVEPTTAQLFQIRSFQRIDKTKSPANATYTYIRNLAKSAINPAIEYDKSTLFRHSLAEKYSDMEKFFKFPHLVASFIFALIQSASEIAALTSPFAAAVDVYRNRPRYSGNWEQLKSVHVTWWCRSIGGLAAAIGFLLCGWRMTRSLGGKLTYISNSRGLASQLSSVIAVIIVGRLHVPVSPVYAFVGSLIGVGIADNLWNVNWKLFLKFLCGWVLTIAFCCGIGYVIFCASTRSPSYIVP
ncbi:hypothetical protein K2173_006658 [Erythroxylum novogranatense]|uniref:Phosphate transporter n=1 Tax=Erythroxylum novogranatense TaxID=1862640 RepID=A0AAV8T5I8_9ROSI|nr:hypothetical protein K2173_006658 [Erythroxylum novogranatense]